MFLQENQIDFTNALRRARPLNYLAQLLKMTEIHAKEDVGRHFPSASLSQHGILDFVKILFDFVKVSGEKL